jgi:predicted hotdog family 3-hydroxylacyl-ACP dehydratase
MEIPQKVIVEGDDILQYIVQRAPIVMVDKFFGIEGDISKTGLMISADNLFCSCGHLQESGIIEHVAQSAAIRTGYNFTRQGKTIPSGLIGSVNNMTIHSLPKVGEELLTEIKVITELFGITLIHAVVVAGASIVAECQMKVAIP